MNRIRGSCYNIIKHYQYQIDQLIIFEMCTQDSSFTNFVARTELLFAVPVPEILKFGLGYCQYLILLDFGVKQKQMLGKKDYGKMLSSEFVNCLKRMIFSQRLTFYHEITQYVFRLTRGDMEPPPIESSFHKKLCYFKKASHKSWHKCQIQHNNKNHLLLIRDLQTKNSNQTYYISLSQYLLRRSKNKDYWVFNLEASDKRVEKNLRSLKLGLVGEGEFKQVFKAIRQSIAYRQWEKVVLFYQRDPVTKNCINSIREIRGCQFSNFERSLQQKEEEQIFYSCYQFPDFDQQTEESKPGENFKEFQGINAQNKSEEPYNALQAQNKKFNIWDRSLKLRQLSEPNSWEILIQNQQFKLSKNSTDTLLLEINLNYKLGPIEFYEALCQKPSNQVQKLLKQQESTFLLYCKKFTEVMRPRVFRFKRQKIKFDQNQAIIHQYTVQNGSPVDEGSIGGQYQAIWKMKKVHQKFSKLEIMLDIDNKGYLSRQKNLKINLNFVKGIFERFICLNPKPDVEVSFFNRKDVKLCEEKEEIILSQLHRKVKYRMSPLSKGKHEKMINEEAQTILNSDWKRDEQKGGLEFINSQKIAAQKGVVKHILSQMGKNLFSGKSILNISLPVEIFSSESHLERLLHSLRLAPYVFQQVSTQQQKQNICEEQLAQILKLSATFGVTMSLLYLSQQKSFNPILGQTSQMWIDGCPGYAEQISHHPPISAIYFIGRGYKIYGQLQAKVELGMNSGKGSNDGQILVQFDNGLKVSNYFASGEVSGLSYGKRKFGMTGKSHHFIESHGLYLEADFRPDMKDSSSREQQLQDQLIGKLYKIAENEIKQFRKTGKFKNPSNFRALSAGNQKALYGRWTNQLSSGQKRLLGIENVKISPINQESSPLPSDCIWRPDIYCRHARSFNQAQKHKLLLQEAQRKDKKLRKPTG